MFDDTKLSVRMNGEEYIKYKESKKIKLSKGVKEALPFFIGSAIMFIFAMALLNHIFYVPSDSLFSEWYSAMPSLVVLSWGGIAKISYLYFAPFIVLAVLISWVVHGVGFFIVRG